MAEVATRFRCIIHGSFRKHFKEIQHAYEIFEKAGIEVLAPKKAEIISKENGFVLFEGEENMDPRLIELLYLHNLKSLGKDGFSYFVNPEGYIGKSASYELGIAQLSNIRCFFSSSLSDHPAYIHKNAIWSPDLLAEYITEYGKLPEPKIKRNEKLLHTLWEDLIVPGSVVAVGGMIEFTPKRSKEKQILLVKTHKWGGKYSMVGGKVLRNEQLEESLLREVKEETGLKGTVGKHITTFDQIKNSGYYHPGVQHIFVDNIIEVTRRNVTLNDEAEEYLWIPAKEALETLDIEPNARHTVELYTNLNMA